MDGSTELDEEDRRGKWDGGKQTLVWIARGRWEGEGVDGEVEVEWGGLMVVEVRVVGREVGRLLTEVVDDIEGLDTTELGNRSHPPTALQTVPLGQHPQRQQIVPWCKKS